VGRGKLPDLSVMFAALDYSIVSTESMSEKSGSVSRMLCFKLCKIMVNKVTFIGFRGGGRLLQSALLDPSLVLTL